MGLGVAMCAAAAFVYGLVWTARIGPGLYLEHLKGDPIRQARLGQRHRRTRLAGMIFVQVACLMVAGYAMTLLIWSRP